MCKIVQETVLEKRFMKKVWGKMFKLNVLDLYKTFYASEKVPGKNKTDLKRFPTSVYFKKSSSSQGGSLTRAGVVQLQDLEIFNRDARLN